MKLFLPILSAVLFICITTPLLGQHNVSFYLYPENMERMIQNNERIISDPSILDYTSDTPENKEKSAATDDEEEEDESDEFESLDESEAPSPLGVYAETAITPTSRFIRLPVNYRHNQYTLSLLVPIYFERSMAYSHGTESSSGIGDVQLKLSYNSSGVYRGETYYSRFSIDLKLPTGDESNQENGFLVPLGTGTTDVTIANNMFYTVRGYDLISTVSYRISGSYNQVAEIRFADQEFPDIIEYSVSNGNTFTFNAVGRYPLSDIVYANAGLATIINSSGSMERTYVASNGEFTNTTGEVSANQDFTFVDLKAGVSIYLFNTDLIFNLMVPLYTQRNASNSESERSTMFYVRLSRNLF